MMSPSGSAIAATSRPSVRPIGVDVRARTAMPMACDAHHIVHWSDGGTTSLDNLIMLCRHHHTLVHHTPWAVHIDHDTRQPVWTPPPRRTLDRLQAAGITYRPARPRAA
ncbi:HNH endonuclease signature motif containing protein [Pimelobacter simplex]|uniref:HNH endonuclease signature motif containing protein n=1 Tax=Nocardioides simplex TaxID=2045 RepID=UPI0019346DA8|nr:HNH endonuclease [Pimelobacter simplex]